MPLKRRPVWTCPRCGARLITKNLWHSCGRFTLDALFARSDPSVVRVARRFIEMLRALGDVQIIPQKTRLVCVARVRFAGLTALDSVSFTVAPGTVHALIGPNGAGKSTCFNVLSGLYRPASGTVTLGGTELTRLAPHRIAALGVARTFQNIVTTEGTVADNLMLGAHEKVDRTTVAVP